MHAALPHEICEIELTSDEQNKLAGDTRAASSAKAALAKARARLKPWESDVAAARAVQADDAAELEVAQDQEGAALDAAYEAAPPHDPATTRLEFERAVHRSFAEPLDLLVR